MSLMRKAVESFAKLDSAVSRAARHNREEEDEDGEESMRRRPGYLSERSTVQKAMFNETALFPPGGRAGDAGKRLLAEKEKTSTMLSTLQLLQDYIADRETAFAAAVAADTGLAAARAAVRQLADEFYALRRSSTAHPSFLLSVAAARAGVRQDGVPDAVPDVLPARPMLGAAPYSLGSAKADDDSVPEPVVQMLKLLSGECDVERLRAALRPLPGVKADQDSPKAAPSSPPTKRTLGNVSRNLTAAIGEKARGGSPREFHIIALGPAAVYAFDGPDTPTASKGAAKSDLAMNAADAQSAADEAADAAAGRGIPAGALRHPDIDQFLLERSEPRAGKRYMIEDLSSSFFDLVRPVPDAPRHLKRCCLGGDVGAVVTLAVSAIEPVDPDDVRERGAAALAEAAAWTSGGNQLRGEFDLSHSGQPTLRLAGTPLELLPGVQRVTLGAGTPAECPGLFVPHDALGADAVAASERVAKRWHEFVENKVGCGRRSGGLWPARMFAEHYRRHQRLSEKLAKMDFYKRGAERTAEARARGTPSNCLTRLGHLVAGLAVRAVRKLALVRSNHVATRKMASAKAAVEWCMEHLELNGRAGFVLPAKIVPAERLSLTVGHCLDSGSYRGHPTVGSHRFLEILSHYIPIMVHHEFGSSRILSALLRTLATADANDSIQEEHRAKPPRMPHSDTRRLLLAAIATPSSSCPLAQLESLNAHRAAAASASGIQDADENGRDEGKQMRLRDLAAVVLDDNKELRTDLEQRDVGRVLGAIPLLVHTPGVDKNGKSLPKLPGLQLAAVRRMDPVTLQSLNPRLATLIARVDDDPPANSVYIRLVKSLKRNSRALVVQYDGTTYCSHRDVYDGLTIVTSPAYQVVIDERIACLMP